MKKGIILCIVCTLMGCSSIQEEVIEAPVIEKGVHDSSYAGEAWYDLVEEVEINREPARSSFFSYANKEEALISEASALDDLDGFSSPYTQSLNGEWAFYYASNVSERLKDINGLDAFSYWESWDTCDWDVIDVPSSVQVQKDESGNFLYDEPYYTNQVYPWLSYEDINYGWQGQPVAPTTNNSVYHYKRSFTVDESMLDRNVFVSFQGVESAFYVYINGAPVGYSEDSYTPAEFNITSYLQEGENTIAVEVYRWSDGSYFENQDFIRLSGIFRDVYLYSKDDIEVRDLFFTSTLSDDYTSAVGNVDIELRSLSEEVKSGYSIKVNLYDQNEAKMIIDEQVLLIEDMSETLMLSTSFDVDDVLCWSAEKPNLYRLTIELIDNEGQVIEAICERVGFREIKTDVIDGVSQMLINGEPIFLKGVNRHETDIEDGRAITKEDVMTDLTLMKAYNINAFRMSHYPNQVVTYDIADEIGLYIVDEANIETHIGEKELHVPGNNPIYSTLILDRTQSMVERDKNHASVLFWSLGNEATYNVYEMDENYAFYQSTSWILERDPSRLRVYERDNRIMDTREESMVDVYSTQYWSIEDIKNYLEENTSAYFQSEYAHSMGNGLGNLQEYYDLFRSYPQLQGGFIWDFIDQSILTTTDGIEYYGYGGDWNEIFHDSDFCGNGLVNADRTPSPELEEVKKVQQNFLFEYKNNVIEIVNENCFTDLNEYHVKIVVTKNNESVSEEVVQLDCMPQDITTYSIPQIKYNEDDLVLLDIYVTYKEDQNWMFNDYGKQGDVLATEQFIINEPAVELPTLVSGELQVIEDKDEIFVSNDDFTISFNKDTAMITEYSYQNKSLINDVFRLNYYRPEVSNDPDFSDEVISASSGLNVKDVQVQNDGLVIIEFSGTTFEKNLSCITYTIDSDGQVQVDVSTTVPSIDEVGEIARVGLEFYGDSVFEEFTYTGKGPFENYVDRNTAAKIGTYTQSIGEQMNEKLLKPQDTGNKTEVSDLTLHGDEIDLCVSFNQKMNINLNYMEDLDVKEASHWYEVEKQEYPIVRLDVASRGLGNASYGPGPLNEYLLKQDKEYNFAVTLTPMLK